MERISPGEMPNARSSGRPTQRQRGGAGERALATILIALALAYVGVAAFAAWQFWQAWQTGDEPYWQRLWIMLVILAILAFAYAAAGIVGIPLVRLRPLIRRFRGENEHARRAAIAGDDHLAPLAARQPEPLLASEIPSGPVQFGPFARPHGRRARPSIIQPLIVVVIVGAVIAALVANPGLVPSPRATPSPLWESPVFLLLAGLVALTGLASLAQIVLLLWRRVRGGGPEPIPHLAADDWGLRQLGRRQRPDRHPIPWHEIRAFYQAEDRLHLSGSLITQGRAQATTYTVDSGDRRLRWSIWQDSTPTQRADSERLCRLIATRTRLPLRDLSALVSKETIDLMALVAPSAGPLLGRRFTYQDPAESPPGSADTLPAGRPLGSRRGRRAVVSGIGLVLVSVLFFGAGMGGQILQDSQYDAIIQHIDYEQPYYDVDFRTNDGAWPVSSAATTAGAYTYAPDGYHMTGAPDGRPMEAVLPRSYGDATVELTAGLGGATPTGDIGVVLRASDDGDAQVIFSVTSGGGWMLERSQADVEGAIHRTVLLSNDHSDSVVTGPGAYNWVTVIMRGGDYLCFVRDHLVGIYHDVSGLTPRQGRLGLWLGNSRALGEFYNFSIYPAE